MSGSSIYAFLELRKHQPLITEAPSDGIDANGQAGWVPVVFQEPTNCLALCVRSISQPLAALP